MLEQIIQLDVGTYRISVGVVQRPVIFRRSVDVEHVPRGLPAAQHRLARPLANRSEHLPVERQHGDARDVERAHRREDEKVRVVEMKSTR